MNTFEKACKLEELIYSSKQFDFVDDNILKIKEYYGNDKIGINIFALAKFIQKNATNEELNEILLNDEELDELE